jgi:alkylation response protein AidB-like acyl-CoA dehydrogenase
MASGELLDAYVNVGKKALEAAAKIAAATSGVGSGGVAIEAALKYANQSIADSPSISSGTQVLDDLATQEAKLQVQLEQQSKAANDKESAATKKPDPDIAGIRKATIDEFQKTLTAFSNAMDVLAKTNQPQDNKDVEESVRSMLK